eukprot:6522150-Ditylum_brightwellii.AAC.1
MDMQTARVGEMVGTLAAQQEATKTKVTEIETTGKDTNNKIDVIMALLQQQSVGVRNQTIQQIPGMGQTMHNQYMAMTPNRMPFQKAQYQMTPEQTMSPYKYGLHTGAQMVSPEQGKEDAGVTQQTYGASIHQETKPGPNLNAESP